MAEVAVYLSHGYYLSNEETPGDGIQWRLLTNKSRLMIWTPVGNSVKALRCPFFTARSRLWWWIWWWTCRLSECVANIMKQIYSVLNGLLSVANISYICCWSEHAGNTMSTYFYAHVVKSAQVISKCHIYCIYLVRHVWRMFTQTANLLIYW